MWMGGNATENIKRWFQEWEGVNKYAVSPWGISTKNKAYLWNKWFFLDESVIINYHIIKKQSLTRVPDFAFFEHKAIVSCQLSFPHSYNIKMTDVSVTVFVHYLSLSVTVCILMHLHHWGIQFSGCFTLYIALTRCLQYFSGWFSQEAQPWWWYKDKGIMPLHDCFLQ